MMDTSTAQSVYNTLSKIYMADEDVCRFVVPEHVNWSFNGIEYAPISNSPDDVYVFKYTIDDDALVLMSIRKAVQNAICKVHELSRTKKFAICLGGADSEIITREVKALGFDAEIFFLDILGINSVAKAIAASIAEELGFKFNVVTLDRETLVHHVIPKNYAKLQAAKPTYLCLPYLFENIPIEFDILGGEGDVQKSGPDYQPFANQDGSYPGLPISITEVFYRQWALENNRMCNMYFYASTAQLVKSYFYNSKIKNANFEISTRQMVDSVWGDLKFRSKTTNWENHPEINARIRHYCRSLNSSFKDRPAICLTDV
jgi:hypothetical protein